MNKVEKKQYVDQIFDRGIIKQVLPDESEFKKMLMSDDPLRIYIGADPTSTSLHLSHAKNYMLLEEFRKLGHKVFVLFGDFTARIGDPTDRKSARQGLTADEIEVNVKGWIDQISPLINFNCQTNPAKIVYNSEWLSSLKFEDVIELASNTTVQRMLERDMFERRIESQKPIFLHEFFYPLMQGYDSVALDVDVELCGTDQTFNALMGRTILKKYSNKEKYVVAVNLMENPVTQELMSKSNGTGVFLESSADDMYGSIMSLPDEMIEVVLINNTRVSLDEVSRIMKKGPRDAKMCTALLVTKIFHGSKLGEAAQNNFINTVQQKGVPSGLPVIKCDLRCPNAFDLVKLCIAETMSNSQIHRLFKQSAIRFDGNTVLDKDAIIDGFDKEVIVNVGKRKWYKVIF